MTVAELIPLAINLSMGLIVLGLGLNTSLGELTYLLREPALLVRSLVAMNVVMPIFGGLIASLFSLPHAILVALGGLALSPVPPVLPNKQSKAGGSAAYIVSLLAIAALLAIVVVPLGTWLYTLVFAGAKIIPVAPIASVIFMSIIVPLVIGMAVHALAPDFAARVAHGVSLAGSILLIVAFIPVLFAVWPLLASMVGNGTLIVLALFTVVGVAVGHFLGGPVEDNRTVLALATGTRHPGVALAIAAVAFPEEKAVLAVVLWHLIVGGIVSVPYSNWRKRVHDESVTAQKPSP